MCFTQVHIGASLFINQRKRVRQLPKPMYKCRSRSAQGATLRAWLRRASDALRLGHTQHISRSCSDPEMRMGEGCMLAAGASAHAHAQDDPFPSEDMQHVAHAYLAWYCSLPTLTAHDPHALSPNPHRTSSAMAVSAEAAHRGGSETDEQPHASLHPPKPSRHILRYGLQRRGSATAGRRRRRAAVSHP